MAVRTNLIPNPSHENGGGAWGTDQFPAGTLTYPSDGGYVGTRYVRRTVSTAGTSIQGGIRYQYDVTPADVGKTFTFSVYVRVSEPQRMHTTIAAISSGVGSSTGTAQDIPANTWVRFSQSYEVPNSSTTSLRFQVTATSGGFGHVWQVGETLDHDAGLLEESAVLGTYFDGDTPDAGAITYSWTGTPHASTSIAGGATLPEQTIPEPYGKVYANNSKANMAVTYRSGWLG